MELAGERKDLYVMLLFLVNCNVCQIELTLLSDNSYSALVEELWTNLNTD